MKLNRFRKFITAVLTVMMAFALCACGKEDYAEYVGTYKAVKGEMMGFSITGDELNDFSIELQKGGKGKIKVSGDSGNITYTIAGSTISMKVDDEEVIGTIADDMIVVEDMLGMGLSLTFGKEGTAAADPANHIDDTNVDQILSELTDVLPEDLEEEPEEKPDPTDITTVWGVWKGSATYTDSWGEGMFDATQECTAIVDYDTKTGRPFLSIYINKHPENEFVHVWIVGSREENSLNTYTFTPDIGEEDCWVGNRYMVHDDAWYFTGVNVDGKMDFEYDFTSSQDDYGCHISFHFEKDPELSRQDDGSGSTDPASGGSGSGGASQASSGAAQTYAGWYKAAIPAGYEPVFDHENYWEDYNTSQCIKIDISTNKAEEYAKEAVDGHNADKAGSAAMYDDVTYNGITWHTYGFTMFSDSINSVKFVAEAVSGQMMSVTFEMISAGDPIVEQFMNSFSLADEAKDDPCAANRNWEDSHK